MADTHAHSDPNAAPMHTDVRESFSAGQIAFCYLLALVSLVAGIASGLIFINE